MASLLGWKEILRPIRDGYRHLFPSPDTGPTPEERRKQRELDRLKGFTYFDTFDQLESWTEAEFDPLQSANTPLLWRRDLNAEDGIGKANVLLIHDHAGNYHDYESVQGVGVGEAMYACEYLQYVDSFIYFSHKLVCVPPPTWTNALHRNGVEVLGTILIEPQTEGSDRLLQHTKDSESIVFPMAKNLANIAMHFGFDGWLVNIEKPFPKDAWNADIMEMFLCQLRAELGESRRLIWYDALTNSNKVSYQNALNTFNLRFAEACGSFLTNYCWTEGDTESSRQLALSSKLLPRNIFFGIDVWAQNTSSFTHPRVTYPEYGGGGTNTGVAVAKLAELGFSAGIFAPAWSFEHFPSYGRDIERVVWQGAVLPNDLDCSCGDCASRHRPNKEFAIINTAREYPVGSESFFYTDFSRAFGLHGDEAKEFFGDHSMHSQLDAQSILPCPLASKDGDQAIKISYRLENTVYRTHLVIEAKHDSSATPNTGEIPEQRLPLYRLDMPANGSLQLEIYSRNMLPSKSGVVVSFYLKTTDAIHLLSIPAGDGTHPVKTKSGTVLQTPNIRLREIGVHMRGLPAAVEGTIRLLDVLEVRVAPRSVMQISHLYNIDNMRLENRGEAENKHVRLCWDYSDTDSANLRLEGMPYSRITGPFSHFLIHVDGLELGRAYALEHILNQKLVNQITGKTFEVKLTGIGFDGRTLATHNTNLHLQSQALWGIDVIDSGMRLIACRPVKQIFTLLRSRKRSQSLSLNFYYANHRQLHASTAMTSSLKRKAEKVISAPTSKKAKVVIPAYRLTASRQDESGEVVWPARKEQVERARGVIKECAKAQKQTLILPDKDADGLSSGAILHHTLTSLGLSSDLISVYFPPKGSNIHDESTQDAINARSPSYIFVLDQGSRKTPPLVDLPHKCLVIDHHFTDEGGFPEGAEYVTAHDCPPVATSALLTYHICLPLHPDLSDKISWLAALGTHGDLGSSIKWEPPFPDMTATFKQHPKKAINDAVALVNAPRRSAAYNVEDAWDVVISATGPGAIKENEKLHDASFEVRRETERCTHTAPKFSADATIAVLTISSAAQIHPIIATRWSGHLKSNKLEIVMCANEGYLPDKVNFSCRVAKVAQAREGEEKVDIIKKLENIVAEDGDLRARLGGSFARGHKEASGGIVGKQEWEEFKKLMGLGEGARTKTEAAAKKDKPAQKNTLANYFGKSAKVTGA
ncbi:hypothetical protein EJ02DRAFT_509822 [Clathrospora elynae]|uniref:Cytosolic endo-beta-N-acetylglucosaminidase TIM barrel domain-containing protein n=1 Tax=Clathrospora elynae TaxID=706981 RepID=A0A6A5SW07_9PLEO|nr:hypothetical protein EJ02DRAFT_509822 [Clathrospora elynae]